MKRKQIGFTIVELLIVIVVIGILAAITIVAYRGVQQRAITAAVNSSVDQWEKTLLQESTLARSIPVNATPSGSTCLGRSATDFPAENGFLAGECTYTTTNAGGRIAGVKFEPVYFQNWPNELTRPTGKTPTTHHVQSGSTVHSRGVILYRFQTGTMPEGNSLVWRPQVVGQCMRGVDPDSTQPSLDGTQCYLEIDY